MRKIDPDKLQEILTALVKQIAFLSDGVPRDWLNIMLIEIDSLFDDDSSQSPCDHQCHTSADAKDHVNGCDYCKENHSSQSEEEGKEHV